MQAAARIAPGSAPRVLAHDDAGVFAMEYLDGARHPLWKSELRAGRADAAFAARVGETLARIHAATAGDRAIREAFATDAGFHAIRLEPYLLATARRHPDLAPRLRALAERTAASRAALVHGDVSPKNILVGERGPVFLDAECAWYGDPAFDLAFCLNHLLRNARGPEAGALPRRIPRLGDAYLAGVTWEPRDVFEARCARLLPGLFLARVDGKSPVEYVTVEADRDRVRACAKPLLRAPRTRLTEVAEAWRQTLARQ
jgi:aminoglycoside phosphotransferase (APT) family kinase protein